MRLPSSFAFVALLLGCEAAPPVIVVPDAGPPPDAYMPPVAAVLFAPCEVDAQCAPLGEGAFCRPSTEGPALGYCTRPCEDRTVCDAFLAHHHCLTFEGETQAICVPACRNGADCPRPPYTCFGGIAPSGDGYCMSICHSDAECGGGAVCNLDSGECVVAPVPSLAAYYAECAADADCTSDFCVEEVNAAGTPTGWALGACLSPCIVPAGYNSTNYFDGDTLPNGGCPGGGSCLPAGGNAEGDLGTCYPTCDADTDCREGYGCEFILGDHTFLRGVCLPRDCRGTTCPGGRRCVTVTLTSGALVGRCAP